MDSDFYETTRLKTFGDECKDPKQMRAPGTLGMGVEPVLEVLGKPVGVHGDD